MSDVDNGQNSSGTSTILNRPQFTPAGPRISSTLRTPIDAPASAATDTLSFGAMSSFKPLPAHPKPLPSITVPQSAASTLLSLEPLPDRDGSGSQFGLLPTDRLTPSKNSSQSAYLSSVNNEDPLIAPAYHNNYSQPDVETASRASPSSESSSLPAKVTVVPQTLPKLTPPPPISFEAATVPWKGMPLEPALWTFNSTELQNIVSRAIRLSAKESFLRLLTIENLDRVLPAELARLAQLKTTTQARYRFLVQRRTMLFHALNTSSVGPKKGDGNEFLVSKLTAQLAETIMDCDKSLEELLRINDQIAQVNKLLDVHSSSALAVALRKLNSSYARRTRDLNKARQRIFQLEAEIEDAWKEAEKLANELDEYEAADADAAIIETAEIVSVPRSPSQSPPPLTRVDRRSSLPMPMTPTLLSVKTIVPFSPIYGSSVSTQSSSASPLAINFVFPPPIPKDGPNDDAVSVKSSKSARSFKSTKSTKGYASSLHAAKKRSSLASRSSLRLSIGSSSHHGRGPSGDIPPPMPEIPFQFVNAANGAGANSSGRPGKQSENMSRNSSSTALHYTTSSRLTHYSDGSLQFRQVKKQASLDTLCTNTRKGSAAVNAYLGRATDDIYVTTGDSHHGHLSSLQTSRGPFSSNNLGWDDDGEIQAVPRTPPYRPNASNLFGEMDRTVSSPMLDPRPSHHIQDSNAPPLPPPKDLLPSGWENVHTVKDRHSRPRVQVAVDVPLPSLPEFGVLPRSVSQTTATSADKQSLLQRSKTLHRIKGFTKRYSASISPIFNGKPSLKKTGLSSN